MALGFLTANQTANIKRFAGADLVIYVKQVTAAGAAITTGDGTMWQCIGKTKSTKIDVDVDTYEAIGDAGKVTTIEETVKSIKVTTTVMNRDAAVRNIPVNAAGNYYLACVVGRTGLTDSAGTTTVAETWTMFGKINQGFSVDLGGTGEISGITLQSLNNASTIVVTPLPTGAGFTTTTVTIAANAMYISSDLA